VSGKKIIIGNFGNDSIALIQNCIKNNIKNLTVVYVDTGWSNVSWSQRIKEVKKYLDKNNIELKILKSNVTFSETVLEKKEFPSQKFQWCAGILKGLPIIEWLDEIDPFCEATVLIAALKSSSRGYLNTEEFIEESEHFGDRKVWHPILELTREERDSLIKESGVSFLPFNRSLECDPCVNCRIQDVVSLKDSSDIEKIAKLENQIGKTLFETDIKSAINESTKLSETDKSDNLDSYNMGCGSVYGCGA